MKRRFYFSLLICAMVCFGCASIQSTVPYDAKPDTTVGYIAGSFTRTNSGGFAFILKNLQTNEEYGFPLGEDSLLPHDVKNQVLSIKVPPGPYSVSGWYTYGSLTKERSKTFEITNGYLAAPFTVAAGTVVYLGNFSISTKHDAGKILWNIQPLRVNSDSAQDAFVQSFSSFQLLPFICRLCRDTSSHILNIDLPNDDPKKKYRLAP